MWRGQRWLDDTGAALSIDDLCCKHAKLVFLNLELERNCMFGWKIITTAIKTCLMFFTISFFPTEICATILLACLFCRISDILPLFSGPTCSCFPVPDCNSRLIGLCSDPQSCCCCCRSDGSAVEFCYQTGDCLELAMEVSELCYH